MSKHLVIVSYDGICTHYCGVGTIIRNTINSLTDLAEKYDFKVSLAYISVNPESDIFNQKCFEESKELVEKTGGKLISLCNGTLGNTEWDMWSRFNEWKHVCSSLATSLNIILDKNDKNIIMLHDTPFLFFQDFKKQIFNKDFKSYFLPHSSGINHNFGDQKWLTERIKNENRLFKNIEQDPNSSMVAEGENFAKHLTENYGVIFKESDYLTNGLYFKRYDNFLNKNVKYEDIKKLDIDIPKDSKIIFSWGRCSIAKGFKELVRAWEKIHHELPEHYLVIQTPNNSGEDDYFQILKKYSEKLPRLIVINDFNPKLWKSFLRYKNTEVVIIPSIMDPNPHTAIEAKLFSKYAKYIIIGSNTDGVKDTYTDKECLLINPHNIKEFADGIVNATNLDNTSKQKMLNENVKNLINYDYKLKIEKFLKIINFL